MLRIHKIFRTSILLCVLVLLSACATDIVDVTGSISGVIKDYTTGQTVQNCSVNLSPGDVTVLSDAQGRYTFTKLMGGSYSLTFSKIGYRDQTAKADVVAGQITNKDIMLEKAEPFDVSVSVLDFGDLNTSLSFSLINKTSGKYDFTIQNSLAWMSLSQNSGTVQANNQLNIVATVNRALVADGTYNQSITINYIGETSGNIVLRISMIKAKQSKPDVTTAEASVFNTSSITISGTITRTGGSTITAYGHCWSKTGTPTINDPHTDFGSTVETCQFNSVCTDLYSGTTYYIRAYAKNALGITYSNMVTATTTTTGTGGEGAQDYGFSITPSSRVQFAPGNLQYNVNTGQLKFADNQWTTIDYGTNGGTHVNGGWTDLFCWGTGDNPERMYQQTTQDLYGAIQFATFTDWGQNAIGNDPAGTWRTLTMDEWDYLLNGRPNAVNLYRVCYFNSSSQGLLILPDNWSQSGLALNSLSDIKSWIKYGAVYFPSKEHYIGRDKLRNVGGGYWTSTPGDELSSGGASNAYGIYIWNRAVSIADFARRDAYYVRLVK